MSESPLGDSTPTGGDTVNRLFSLSTGRWIREELVNLWLIRGYLGPASELALTIPRPGLPQSTGVGFVTAHNQAFLFFHIRG